MTPEYEKYRAEIFKIAGFAMLSPLGRFFLQPIEIIKEYGLVFSFLYFTFGCLLFYVGLLFITKGFEVLELERENR